ncbi:MAG: tRNA (N(6)-L-threonylcarbamoyladenosine(37)-C(2))-methylthiotransferase MtaB [Pseudomonadota bacterium]
MTKTAPHMVTLGCRLNGYESERMATLAAQKGAPPTVVINTCAVTGEAVRQSRQAIRRARKDNPNARVVVTGCAVQLEPEAFSQMPEVDRVLGNGEKLDPKAWAPERDDQAVGDVFDAINLKAKRPPPGVQVPVRAHLEVQNGCDHRCTFCIIPFGRGSARSKPPQLVADEGLALAERGAKEIVLTGVDLTSYGPDLGEGVSLSDGITALLNTLPSAVTIRLSSIDGAEVDDRLFELLTQENRIAPYLHLSLQAGDNMILKRMKRRHSREEAVTLCNRLKDARNNISFGADLIAGFPTETDEMAARSLDLVDDCQLSFVHVFPFSPRNGTPAARMPQLTRDVVKARAARLRQKADEALSRHLALKIGRTEKVLVEQVRQGCAMGKMPDFTDVTITEEAPVGAHLFVRITAQEKRSLLATQEQLHA